MERARPARRGSLGLYRSQERPAESNELRERIEGNQPPSSPPPSTSLTSTPPPTMAESPNVPGEYAYDGVVSPFSGYPTLEDDGSNPAEGSGGDEDDRASSNASGGLLSPAAQASPFSEPDYTAPPPPAASLPPPPPPPSVPTTPVEQPFIPGTTIRRNPALHPTKRDLPVPTVIPGELVQDPEKHWNLRRHLADLCGTGTARYVAPSLSLYGDAVGVQGQNKRVFEARGRG